MWYMCFYQLACLSMIYVGCRTIEEFNVFLGIYFIIVAISTMAFFGIRMCKCARGGILPEDCPDIAKEYANAQNAFIIRRRRRSRK